MRVQCIVSWNTLNMDEETSETREHVQYASYTIVYNLEIHLLPSIAFQDLDIRLLQKDTLRFFKKQPIMDIRRYLA